MTSGDEIVRGETLAARFARGELDEVVAGHLRAPAVRDLDRAAVIGAYAWSGRLDEALAQHEAFLAAASTPTYRDVAGCHLVIGHCHAGELGAARRLARELAAAPPADGAAAYRHHAAAFVAFFRGRMGRCARRSRQALRAAVGAGDALVQLLANDLLAHATFLRGHTRAAHRVLARAIHLSAELNLTANYLNLLATREIFAITAEPADAEAAGRLAALLDRDGVSYVARRHGHAALAVAACLRGELAAARGHLALVAGSGGAVDARTRVRLLCARASLGAARGERAAAADTFARALTLALRHRHVDLVAETAFLRRLWLGGALVPTAHPVIRKSDIARLRWARGEAPAATAAIDDGLLVWASAGAAPARARALEAGLLGLAAAALPPGEVVAIGAPGAGGPGVLVRDPAAVALAAAPSDTALRLLRALAAGPRRKPQLVTALWGLTRYHPHLHDGTLYTAVSRLRRALGPHGAWLETTVDGYQLRPGVTVVTGDAPVVGGPPAARSRTLTDRLVEVAAGGGVTCAEAARAIGVSPSTALRALRALVAAGAIVRLGSGAGTRYARARDDEVPGSGADGDAAPGVGAGVLHRGARRR